MISYLVSLSMLIAVILLVRGIFRKTVSPRVIYALWLVVVLRMLVPISLFEADVTLPDFLQRQQTVPKEQTELTDRTEQPPKTPEGSAEIQQTPSVSPPVQAVPSTPSQSTSQAAPEHPTVVAPITPEASDAPSTMIPDTPKTDLNAASPSNETASEKPKIAISVNRKQLLNLIWLNGAVISAAWVLLTSLTYQRRLHKGRVLHRTVRGIKVYISEYAGVPCIAGLIPSIYITPEAANSAAETMITVHEHVHIRHGDHIWSVFRALALIVFWWNPLVWLAAAASKQDAELACDDAIASRMNDEGRLKYAHVLLDTIPQCSHDANRVGSVYGFGGAPMKERILMLTKKQKNRVLCLVLAIVLVFCAVGCSFISWNEQPSEESSEDASNGKVGLVTESLSDFLTEEQIALYEKAGAIYPLFQGVSDNINILHLVLEGASAEEQETYRAAYNTGDEGVYQLDGVNYLPSYGEYDTFDAFKALCVSVFTEEYFEALNAADPYSTFIDHNDKLYNIDAARGGRFGYAPDEFPDEYEVAELSDEVIVFHVTGHYKSSNVDPDFTVSEETFTVKMVLTEDGWRFARFAYAGLDEVPTEEQTDTSEQAGSSVVNVIDNSGGLHIHTICLPIGENYTDAFRYDDRHILYVTWKDSQKNANGLYSKTGVHFYLIDILNGEIAAEAAYNGSFTSYYDDDTDDGLVLYDILYPDDASGDIRVIDPIRITYENGALRIKNAQKDRLYPRITERMTSPTGEYEVYNISESDGNILYKTSLEVRYADGSVRRLFQNRTLEDGASLSDVFTYTPIQFADDTHFVYILGGYESTKGFGIYDLATDKKTEFDHGAYDFCLAKDGAIIFREIVRNNEGLPEPYRLWSMTLDGEKTLLASLDEADGVMSMPGDMSYRRGEAWISFIHNSAKALPAGVASTCVYQTEELYSLDMSKKLAVIEYPSNGYVRATRNIHFFEDSVIIVLPLEPTS